MEVIPLHSDGTPKVKFEIKFRKGKNGTFEKSIFIDNELLDWSVDISSLLECKKMGINYYKAAQKDIEKHFIEAVSDTLGRKVTVDEIKNATKTGWI